MSIDAPVLHTPTEPSSERESGESIELSRGAEVGRYLVLEKIGSGGMGVVYAAFDPKLDRRIALKALHTASDPERDTAGRSRLIREAKAMARLSHPNVVTVYDVLAEGEKIYVAMELVEGVSLRTWLEQQPRPWPSVVAAFVQAGRGLAAAHDASMVHRDFKLDNVFVGNDGRVRVGDFGLARTASSTRTIRRAKKDDLGPLVSREGMLAGTPAYMAPDQLRGDPADARSDQFSFCVALYEGLYGAAPFEATTLETLVESMEEDRVAPAPSSSAVPSWLRAIVGRGLRARPEERFQSMHELLTALETDPSRARVRRAWVIGAVAVVLAGGGVVAQNRRAGAAECRAAQRRVEAVWGDAQRRAVRDAFVATGRPYAGDMFDRAARVLDTYAQALGQHAFAVCEEREPAARRAIKSDRATCLDGRLDELRAFVGVLARPEGETVDRAVQGARALPSLETCMGADPLRDRAVPSDPAVRDEATALEERMHVEKALRAGGRFTEAVALATSNVHDAERLAFRPLLADALLALAVAQEDGADPKDSSPTYHRASVAAEAAGAARDAALAWIGVGKRATAEGDFARADERFDHAEAWTSRVADDDELGATLLLMRGRRLCDEGKYDAARELQLRALPIYERHGSEQIPETLNDLGIDADLQGRYEEAKSYYRRAMEQYERVLGPDHPKVAKELNNLGLMAADQGKNDEAVASLRRALEINERAFGPDKAQVGSALYNLAMVLTSMGRNEESLALSQRAVGIVDKATGPTSPDMAYALSAMTLALVNLGRAGEAVEPAERELAIRQSRSGSEVNLADAQCDLGVALVKSGRDVARGSDLLRRAREGFVSIGRTNRLAEIDDALAKVRSR